MGISLSGLAGAVAAAGGSASFLLPRSVSGSRILTGDPIACNLRTIGKEIEKSKADPQKGGIIGVNIMVATATLRGLCQGSSAGL